MLGRAVGYTSQALVIHREKSATGAARGTTWATWAMLMPLGRRPRAIGYYEQQLVITREIGDRQGGGTL